MTALAEATVLSPAGAGALSVVRLEGVGARRVLERSFRAHRGGPPAEGRLCVGVLRGGGGGDGQACDEVVVAALGPETFEVSGHGGRGAVQAVLAALADAGAGVRAERRGGGAVADARTWLGARLASLQEAGRLCAVGPDAAAALDALLHPRSVVIAGAANAGKSTLLNALLDRDEAIASAEPGTTRDALCHEAAVCGVPIELTDTAGLLEATGADPHAAAAAARARDAVARAHVLLIAIDGSAATPAAARGLLRRRAPGASLVVLTKADVPRAPTRDAERHLPDDAIAVSAHTGAGMQRLVRAIATRVLGQDPGELEARIEECLRMRPAAGSEPRARS
jgi:small GTP-binding protein